MKPRSILFLGTQMAVGGAQKLLLEQAQWFYERGYHTTVVFFYDRDNLSEKWKQTHPFEIQNLEAFDKKAGGFRNAPTLLGGLLKLWRILKRGHFDAVIAFTHDSNLLGLPLAWLAGIPARVGTNLGEIRGMSKWRENLHMLLVNRGIIQMLVASSARTRNNSMAAGVDPQKITTIYNAIMPFDVSHIDRESARRKLGLQKDDIFFVAVGRLVYEKGHEFFINAMSQVAKEDARAVAGICGAGPLRDPLQTQIERLNLPERVKLLGQWDSIPELLAAADVFVLPSRWEGLPMALLEGMMAGLPVIATRVEGVDEVVQHGVQGLLVQPESSDELARAILQLLRSPQDRQRMGAAARERVLQSYTTDRMCEAYLRTIERIPGEKKARSASPDKGQE